VITPKKKARQWIGLQVEGLWFDYEAIRSKLQWIHAQMYRRFPLINEGAVFELTNFVVEDLNWNQMILGMSEEQINELIEQRRSNSVSPNPDTTDTPEVGQDTADTKEIRPDTPVHNESEPADTVRDTYLDTDTYTPEDLARDFPDTTPEELFHRIQDTTLPPSRFIKEELKCTKPERYRLAQKAIGYLLRVYPRYVKAT
jgi:hypothetical protein